MASYVADYFNKFYCLNGKFPLQWEPSVKGDSWIYSWIILSTLYDICIVYGQLYRHTGSYAIDAVSVHMFSIDNGSIMLWQPSV